MYIKVEPNPDGGPDNAEAKWWKGWATKKQQRYEADVRKIEELKQEVVSLSRQQEEEREVLSKLCERYDEIVKQLAAEQRIAGKPEHRRLEVD